MNWSNDIRIILSNVVLVSWNLWKWNKNLLETTFELIVFVSCCEAGQAEVAPLSNYWRVYLLVWCPMWLIRPINTGVCKIDVMCLHMKGLRKAGTRWRRVNLELPEVMVRTLRHGCRIPPWFSSSNSCRVSGWSDERNAKRGAVMHSCYLLCQK